MLDALAKTYRGLKTYRDTARARVVAPSLSREGRTNTLELTSSSAFVRPDRLRVEFQRRAISPQAEIGLEFRYLLGMKGDVLQRVSTRDALLGPPVSLDGELGGVAGGSYFLAHNVVHLLLGTRGIPPYLSELEQAKRLDDDPVSGVKCHRVQGLSGMWNVTIWVDAQSGLLRRIDLKNRTADSSITIDPVADQPISDKLLEFQAPAPGTRGQP